MQLVQPKSVLKCRKSEFDGYLDDDEALNSEIAEDSSHSNNAEFFDTNVSNKSGSELYLIFTSLKFSRNYAVSAA